MATEGGDKRKWEYTLASIAKCSGVSINTVRDHKQKGLLDPDDLGSVSSYIQGHRLQEQAKTQHARTIGRDVEVDAFGDPV